MQIASPRPPIPPLTSATRCAILFSSLSDNQTAVEVAVSQSAEPNSRSCLLAHVTSRRGVERRIVIVAWPVRCRALRSGLPRQPCTPVRPPASLLLFCTRVPLVRTCALQSVDPVLALVFRRRIDDAGDVAAAAEHEFRIAAEQHYAAIRRAPRDDMVIA